MSELKTGKETSEKKSFFKFILILIASAIGGAITGAICVNIEVDKLTEAIRTISPDVGKVVLGIFVLENLILFGLSLKKYLDARKMYRQSSDDDVCDDVERMLDYPMLYSNVAMVMNYMLFSLCIWCGDRVSGSAGDLWFVILCMGGVAVFVLGFVWEVSIQFVVVRLTKEMNPEKKGSIFEMNFRKKWEESCDEGQKLILYKSGYKAFVRMQMACTIMWLITILSQMYFKTGILPVISVCVIFMVGIVSYMLEGMRLEHPKN